MLNDSIVDKLKSQKESAQAEMQKRQKDFQRVLNGFLSSSEGKLFWKELSIYCGLYNVDNSPSNDILRENNGKRKVITEFLLPLIDSNIRRELLND